jgi:deoxycytidylate deaminase
MIGPCAKQVVVATVVTPSGLTFSSSNFVRNPQPSCPRAHLPSGVGYEMCRDICDQPEHAEINALVFAGSYAEGATLYLEGHSYACDSCVAACDAAGIAQIVIGASPA